MGFRFRKSINLGGGVRLNVGKKGVGVSAGVKGLRVSHGADGKTRVTASVPGTGLSYQETVGGKKVQTKKSKPRTPQQFDEQDLLYSFQGIIRAIHENGSLVYDEFTRNFYNGSYTVSFYIGTVHMFDPNRGEQTQYAFVGDIKLRKKIVETGFWVFKGSRTDLVVEINGTEYSFEVPSEAAADHAIAWHTDFMENWNSLGNYDVESVLEDNNLPVFGEDNNFLDSDWNTGNELADYNDAYEDGFEDEFLDYNDNDESGFEDVYSDHNDDYKSGSGDEYFSSINDDDVDDQLLVMSCTHCYTRDVIESWQISEDEDSGQTLIYCKHCSEEFDSIESFEWESQFLNPEGQYAFDSMMCGNCYEDISLIGVRFEDGAANVECPHCKVNITVSVPE